MFKVEIRNNLGQLHNENGPALVTDNGDEHWYIDGVRHNLSGPAVKYHSGAESYYIDGVPFDKEEYLEKIELMTYNKQGV